MNTGEGVAFMSQVEDAHLTGTTLECRRPPVLVKAMPGPSPVGKSLLITEKPQNAFAPAYE